MQTTTTVSANVTGQCIMCKFSLLSYDHKECLLKGLESGLFKSKADWLKQCKIKRVRMIRMALVD